MLGVLVITYEDKEWDDVILDRMILSSPEIAFEKSNPCESPIRGDPEFNDQGYLKVFIKCSDNLESIRTLDLRGVRDRSVGGVLELLGKIEGFRVQKEPLSLGLNNSKDKFWSCKINGNSVEASFVISKNQMLECEYN